MDKTSQYMQVIDNLQGEIERLRKQCQKLQGALAFIEERANGLANELEQTEKERDDWKERYEELANSLLEENL